MLLPDSKTELVRRGNKVVYDRATALSRSSTRPSRLRRLQRGSQSCPHPGVRHPQPQGARGFQLENANGWALATEKVPGTTLAEKMTAEPQRFGEYLEMFVDLQIEIHGHTSPLLNRQRDKYARMIDSLDRAQCHHALQPSGAPRRHDKEFKVCHGDFNPSNVIVGDDGLLYVCDWAHATQGSPAADVATTYLLFALNRGPGRGLPGALLQDGRHAHAGRASVDEHRRRFRARS